jgi:hypothetical protein
MYPIGRVKGDECGALISIKIRECDPWLTASVPLHGCQMIERYLAMSATPWKRVYDIVKIFGFEPITIEEFEARADNNRKVVQPIIEKLKLQLKEQYAR